MRFSRSALAVVLLAQMTLLADTAHAAEIVEMDAVDGQVTQGIVEYKDLAIPGDASVGYVGITLVEDGTRQRIAYRQEDRSCVLIALLHCERESKRLAWLQPGMHLRIRQSVSYWTGRRSLTIENLAP